LHKDPLKKEYARLAFFMQYPLGGYAQSNTGNATAMYNTVTIKGAPAFAAGAILYGGKTSGPGVGDVRTGNTLNLHSPVTVFSAQNFENWNFYLPSIRAVDGAMLKVNGAAELGTNARVNVSTTGSNSPLRQGETVKLIDAGTLTGTAVDAGQGMHGVTLKYEFDLLADTANGLLTATVAKVEVNEASKAFSEGFVGGVSLVTQGGDAAAGEGMAQAVDAANGAGGGAVLAGFGALSAGSTRINSGSHVNMRSVSLMAGVAKGMDLTSGRLTLGGFFEYGNGSYDTYNSFANAASVKGTGDMHNIGGGVLGRMSFTNTGPGRAYTEASFRGGPPAQRIQKRRYGGGVYIIFRLLRLSSGQRLHLEHQ